METRVVTSHLPADLAEKLDGLAERLDRPRGWIVKEAISSYVALEEERRRLTLEALADVKAGARTSTPKSRPGREASARRSARFAASAWRCAGPPMPARTWRGCTNSSNRSTRGLLHSPC